MFIDSVANRSWFIPFKRNDDARLRLFCFPYAGGGPSVFRRWAELLSPDVEMLAMQAPGRGTRFAEPPIHSLRAMIPSLTEAIEAHLDRPYLLFGHSSGALVSFELAAELQRLGLRPPQHIIVSGKRAPQLARDEPVLHDLPTPELIQRLKEYGGTPEDVLQDKELIELLLPVLRADFSVVENYQYAGGKVRCDASLFGGLRDEYVPEADLKAWAAVFVGRVSCRMFAGDHFFVQDPACGVIDAVNTVAANYLPSA